MNKTDIDKVVAQELGEDKVDVSLITELFLTTLMKAVASGEVVHFRNFGTFRLANQGGGPIPRFGPAQVAKPAQQRRRFRVHFSKAAGFRKEVQEQQGEARHGKVRRR